MAVPQKLIELMERFDRNQDDYRSDRYNEAQLRQEFIDPFFESLGWDVSNEQGSAEAYKDVIHEDAIKIGGVTKAPDYCFRYGGIRKFFVEAKKPAINIRDDAGPAFQLRRYAWSAKLPLSILTNFEEFAVYDCRIKPERTDKAATARIRYLRYTEYPQQWNGIAALFTKEAIRTGAFNTYAESTKSKKGTAEVDIAFLKEIESWRELLAKNIALRNPDLSQPEMNFAVQQTIDRIIFLRICEDRGIEPYGRLKALQDTPPIYEHLCQLFRQADDRYNSGLFHFRKERDRSEPPDQLSLGLAVDDKPLKDILRNLYYPDSPYEFSVLPVDILGQVYEQFLGKEIRLTAGHRAVVEDKPEVKKAGGVYYTPTRIVEYIVRHTVRKLLEGKTPSQAAKLKTLDPACGSGSFLIGVYQYLLDWHRDWYVADNPQKHIQEIYQGPGGEWRLATTERKRILLNNIYGVDVDPQAVEVTQLSLLLKVLEGENAQAITRQLKLFQERALPDLGNNIRCGNSLIGPDFYGKLQLHLHGDETQNQINTFDWKARFPEVFHGKDGGFDAVIGNPPYLFITELDEVEKRYFSETYVSAEYRFDVYGLFVELSVRSLLRPGGLVSFITPHTLLNNDSFEKLRSYLLRESYLHQVIDIGPGVFQGAKNETMIFIAEKRRLHQPERFPCQVVLTTDKDFPEPSKTFAVNQAEWEGNFRSAWLVRISPSESKTIAKLESVGLRLGSICTINQGLRTGDNEKYLSTTKSSGRWKPAVGGKGVGRYEPLPYGQFVYYNPAVLDAPRKKEIFESVEKLVVQEIRNITLPRRIVATFDNNQFYCLQSTNVINCRDEANSEWQLKYLLGILNSALINFFFRQKFSGNNHIASNQLAQIPIARCGLCEQGDIATLVERLLSLHKQLVAVRTNYEQNMLQHQIEATDRQIDRLVYELYGLSEEEIQIVENG